MESEEIKMLKSATKRRYRRLVERAKIYGISPLSFSELWEVVLKSYREGFRCFYCGTKMISFYLTKEEAKKLFTDLLKLIDDSQEVKDVK